MVLSFATQRPLTNGESTMRKFSALLTIVFLWILAAPAGHARAAEAGLSAVNVSGNVMLKRTGEDSALKEGDALQPGDQITTDGDSRLDVVKAGDWGFRLLQSGDCRIAAAAEESQVELDQGNIIFNVKPRQGQNLSVKTPVVTAAVRGTQFWGQVTPSGEKHNAIFAVREGTVEVKVNESGEKFLLEAGQAVEIKGETGAAVPRAAQQAELDAISQAESITL